MSWFGHRFLTKDLIRLRNYISGVVTNQRESVTSLERAYFNLFNSSLAKWIGWKTNKRGRFKYTGSHKNGNMQANNLKNSSKVVIFSKKVTYYKPFHTLMNFISLKREHFKVLIIGLARLCLIPFDGANYDEMWWEGKKKWWNTHLRTISFCAASKWSQRSHMRNCTSHGLNVNLSILIFFTVWSSVLCPSLLA